MEKINRKIKGFIEPVINQYKKNKKQKNIKKYYCKYHPNIMLTKDNNLNKYYCVKCKKWTKI